MNRVAKALLTTLLILFFSTQISLTLFGGFLWPFSGHRLFSQRATLKKTIVQAILIDHQGREYAVHPGRAIPIEYSRCSGLIRTLYQRGTKEQQQKLCLYLLKRLNENPWWAFDEMFSAVRPIQGSFVHLRFEHHTIRFHSKPYPVSIELLERKELFP